MLNFIFKKPVGFFLLTLLLSVTGIFLATRFPVLMYPQTRRPRVSVNISHPGISAVDFASEYADNIESSILSLEDLDLLETSYSTDSSRFNLTFNWNIKSEDAHKKVEDLMESVNGRLPSEIQDSYSVRFREGENAGYLVMGITSDSIDRDTLYKLLRDNIEPKLGGIEGVEDIGIYNTRRLVADVNLRQRRMLAYGITISDVQEAFQRSFNTNPLGAIRTEDGRISIRLIREANKLEDLPRLEIAKIGSTSISLDEIADLDIRYTLPRQLFLVGDNPAVQLTATPVEGGNVPEMTKKITSLIDSSIESGLLPKDTAYDLYLDPAKYIQRSIQNVILAALLGGVLAIIVVFLVLGELKNTFIITISLPISIILSFILMYIFNVTLNLISLGGLALAVGMVVDSTIVVMENIHRLRVDAGGEPEGNRWKEIVKIATAQVRSPVIASTLTSVLVFLPISFTAPLTNAILGDQSRTVVFSLLCSLLVSLTIVPLFAYILFRGHKTVTKIKSDPRNISAKVVHALIRVYKRLLNRLLSHKLVAGSFIFLSVSLLLLLILLVMPLIPKEIISTPRSDRIVIFFRNQSITDKEVLISEYLPEITNKIDSALGDMVAGTYTNISGFYNQIFVDLKSSRDSEKAIGKLQHVLLSEGDWYYNILSWDPAELPLPRTLDFQLTLFGPEDSRKVELLSDIQRILNNGEVFNRIFTQPSSSIIEQLNVTPREEVISSFPSITINSLSSLIRRTLSGTSSITLSDGENDVEVSAQFPSSDFDSIEKLENYLIPLQQNFVPLRHFFYFETEKGVSQIYAENGETVFRVSAIAGFRVSDSLRVKLQEQARQLLDKELVLPKGYHYTIGIPNAELTSAINTLYIALGISIVLIYLLLSFQFNSLRIPLIILITIPLGFIGVILSLWLFGSALNLNSMLGTILLGGIVVNNAIILIDFYLHSRSEYNDDKEAIISTAAIRFQPILITTLTTIFGMMPLAMGLGEGSNILQPLGIAVSGGLLFSATFTLFAVPALLFLTYTRTSKGKINND